ncbi:hypothetical protein Dimus_016163 [Dionaea muscipula]
MQKCLVIHSKKKDVVKSKVRGVEMEFDHEKLATILGVPGTNEICEYRKDVWEEFKYTKPLEIIRRFANDENLMAARRVKSGELNAFQRFVHFLITNRLYGDRLTMVFEAFGVPLVDKKGEEPKRYDYFQETFLTMCKLTRENWVWWIGSGENRRRNDDVDAPEEEAEEEDAGNKDDFDWEVVIDEAVVEGESGSERNSLMLRIRNKTLQQRMKRFQQQFHRVQLSRRNKVPQESTPRVLPRNSRAVMTKSQAEFERKRANRFLADLEKAKAENARLLALLH